MRQSRLQPYAPGARREAICSLRLGPRSQQSDAGGKMHLLSSFSSRSPQPSRTLTLTMTPMLTLTLTPTLTLTLALTRTSPRP